VGCDRLPCAIAGKGNKILVVRTVGANAENVAIIVRVGAAARASHAVKRCTAECQAACWIRAIRRAAGPGELEQRRESLRVCFAREKGNTNGKRTCKVPHARSFVVSRN